MSLPEVGRGRSDALVRPLDYHVRRRRRLPAAARWGLLAVAGWVFVASVMWWVDRTRVLDPVTTRPSRMVADFQFSLSPRYLIEGGGAGGKLDDRRGLFTWEFDYAVTRADEGPVDPAAVADAVERWVARQVVVTGTSRGPAPAGAGVSRAIDYEAAETAGRVTVTVTPPAGGTPARVSGKVTERRK